MLVAAVLGALVLAQVRPPLTVEIGRPIAGDLRGGAEGHFRLVDPTEGALTVSVESFDFAPRLRVRAGESEHVGERAGAGVWSRVEVPPAAEVEIVLGIEHGSGGPFLLVVHAGHVAPPQETEIAALQRVYGTLVGIARERRREALAHSMQHRLGEQLFQRAEYPAAREAHREALALAEAQGNARGVVAARAFLGAVERRIGSTEEALRLLEQAYEHRGEIGTPAFECFLLENLGEAHFARQEFDAALVRFQEFEACARRAGIVPFQALALSRCANAHERLGDDATDDEHAEALALLETFDEPHLASQVLLAAGQYHERRARHETARQHLQRALDLALTWEVLLTTAIELGQVCVQQGRYGQARACMERARAAGAGRDDTRYDVDLQIAMSVLAFHTGDLHEALRLVEGALALTRERGNLELEVMLLTDLGMLQERLGEPTAAAAAYEQAWGLCAGLDAPELQWKVLVDQGRLAVDEGRAAEAVSLHRRALALADEMGDPAARAVALNGIAWATLALDDPAEARRNVEEALALHEATGEVVLLLAPLHTLALVALSEGRLDEVQGLLRRADDLLERDDVTRLPAGEAAGVRSAFAWWAEVAQDLVAARLQEPRLDANAVVAWGFRQAGRWKGRALLEDLPPAEGAEDVLAPVRAALGNERVLVEYVNGKNRLYAYVLDAGGLAFVDLGPTLDLDEEIDDFLAGMTDLRALATADEIARSGSRLYERLLAPVLRGLDEGLGGLVVVPTPDLARLSFGALVLGGEATAERLTFADVVFVADRFDVTYGPSTPVLARLAALGPRAGPGRALVLGDPFYAGELAAESTATLRTEGGERYQRLRGTRGESLALAAALLPADGPEAADERALLEALGRERSGSLHAERFDLHLGKEACAARLRGDLREYALLHIAAHGEVDARDPLAAGLVLALEDHGHGHVTATDIADLQLDAQLVTLSACDTARGRVLPGEGVQSLATAFLRAGARGVVASLWSVDDESTRDAMSRFYAGLLRDERSPSEALVAAKVHATPGGASPLALARGRRLGEPRQASESRDRAHPYYWAPFIYIGASP